ncbi:Dehydrogenase [Aspergillus sclerotialis]|uniref:D-xylulose reductase n=1 Tax=Aspergillus sclerotialis TaxID=2070753 RepID=A0A3A2ZHN8_9EURO|nr:Dehydrogenase [Aspergillus sclerotialis]
MSPSLAENTASNPQESTRPITTMKSATDENEVEPLKSNPSLQVTADHQLKQVEAPIISPGKGEALLHIKATGICGSDVHFWKAGRIGPLIFEGDYNLKPGDRVAIEPGASCGTCFLCTGGRYNLCEDVQFAGVYPYHGTMQRYKTHPAKWLHRLPDNVSYAEGALLEPLSVVMNGIRSAGLSLGRGVVVCGAGPIGLIALAAARASGAHPVVITDIDPGRLAFARKFVPSCMTYQVNLQLDAEGNGQAIKALFGSEEYFAPETVLECTGVESSICTAAFTARRGGTVMVIGVGKPIINNIPFMHISLAEIQLKFINRYNDTWPPAIACISGGILDLKDLVTHTFPLEKAKEALGLASDTRNGAIKIIVAD